MTDFQYQATMAKRDAAVAQALAFLRAGDAYMFTFWTKVARAFEAMALDDSILTCHQQEVVYEMATRRTT